MQTLEQAPNSQSGERTRKPNRWKSILTQILLTVGVAIFAAYVWPTQWTYYQSGSANYRTERFTDKTQLLSPQGWITIGTSQTLATTDGKVSLPAIQLQHLTIDSDSCTWNVSTVTISVYNGTSYSIGSVTVPITLYSSTSIMWTRNYIFDNDGLPIKPSSSETLYRFGMPYLPPGSKWQVGNITTATID